MQRVLQLLLGLVGQRGLEDGAAVLGQRGRGLVRGHLLDHHEQRRRAGLQHLADLVLEGLIDTGLADTPARTCYTENGCGASAAASTPASSCESLTRCSRAWEIGRAHV